MQISTSAPPTLTAVTPMRSVTIPWVHTNARVMLGTQEMENIAMVFEIQLILSLIHI